MFEGLRSYVSSTGHNRDSTQTREKPSQSAQKVVEERSLHAQVKKKTKTVWQGRRVALVTPTFDPTHQEVH